MSALLRAEVLKLRTTRTFPAVVGAAVATSVLVAGLTAALAEPERATVGVDVFGGNTSTLFILVLAVVGAAGEWRHRTITGVLLVTSARGRFLGAKAVALAGAGLGLSLAVALVTTAVGGLILAARDLPLPGVGDMASQMALNALAAALLGALGAAAGALIRNQVVAVVGLLVAAFAVEPVVMSMVPGAGRFGPLVALPLAVAGIPVDHTGLADTGVDLLATPTATLALLGWAIAALALAAALLRRRDVE